MNDTILKGCLAVALTVGLQSVCFADDSVSTTTTSTEGPPVVLDSYMKPTVVQTKETTDAAGNVQRSVAPIIQERHEHVMLPASETTSTVTEHTGSTTAVRTESRVAQSTFRSAPKRKIAHQVRHHRRSYAAVKPKSAAYVANKVVVEKRVVDPTVIQRQDTTVSKATITERRDPSLDNQ
ncbi:MAG: hypothetical protein HYX67_05735 [Candidatus Melainabacteria bacterium]|nr:hypothetical protein [Candidatus Melainabacteria bacterium]